LSFSDTDYLERPVVNGDGFPDWIDEWKQVVDDICTDDADASDMVDVVVRQEPAAVEFVAKNPRHFRRVTLDRRIQELPAVFHLRPRIDRAANRSAIRAGAPHRLHVFEVNILSLL